MDIEREGGIKILGIRNQKDKRKAKVGDKEKKCKAEDHFGMKRRGWKLL